MFRPLRLVPALIACLLLASPVLSQEEGLSQKQQEKIQAKKKKQQRKDQKDLEKELRKQHLALQDKSTRKRMKEHDRRADKHGSNTHRDPFLKRIFTRKR